MYVTSLISISLVLSKIWPRQAYIIKKWLREDNSINIKGKIWLLCTALLTLSSIYKPSLISITFVLLKIWPRTDIHNETWLRGDNSINIQGRIIVLGFCHSAHCHLSINQVSFKSRPKPTVLSYLPAGWTDKATTICFPLWGA